MTEKKSLYSRKKKCSVEESLQQIEEFAAKFSHRVVSDVFMRETFGDDISQTHSVLQKSGYTLLTHRECPQLLTREQMLLWPVEESLPEGVRKLPAAPAYDPDDGRRFVPAEMLNKDELVNQLFEGDCLKVLPYFPSRSVDMILCDLPYGITQNKWDSLIPLEPLWQQYERILKPGGAVVLTSQGLFTARLILSNEKWFKYKIVWEKSKPTNFLNAKKQPLRKHEDVCVFYPRQPVYNPQMTQGEPYDKGVRKNQLSGSYGDFLPVHVKSDGARYPTDIVYFKTAESEGPVWHPTQKPVELGRYLIRTFTNPGALILDNAFGSGSFLVAAVMENRRFVGIEQNTDVHLFKKIQIDFVGLAARRISEASPNLEACGA